MGLIGAQLGLLCASSWIILRDRLDFILRDRRGLVNETSFKLQLLGQVYPHARAQRLRLVVFLGE